MISWAEPCCSASSSLLSPVPSTLSEPSRRRSSDALMSPMFLKSKLNKCSIKFSGWILLLLPSYLNHAVFERCSEKKRQNKKHPDNKIKVTNQIYDSTFLILDAVGTADSSLARWIPVELWEQSWTCSCVSVTSGALGGLGTKHRCRMV